MLSLLRIHGMKILWQIRKHPKREKLCECNDEDSDYGGYGDVKPPPPQLKNLREVTECLKGVHSTLG